MPRVKNQYGIETVVSEKRAAEMVREGAVLLDKPDQTPDAPVDTPLVRAFQAPEKVITRAMRDAKLEAEAKEPSIKEYMEEVKDEPKEEVKKAKKASKKTTKK